jgi:glycosyltransferase involved in cell wall biosynthesis
MELPKQSEGGLLNFIAKRGDAGVARTADRAASAMRARKWDIAALHYEKLLKIRPDDAGAWVQYGHALKEAGNRMAAEAAYRHALSLDPELPDTHFQLGYLLKLQGRTGEAADAYLRALALAPTFRLASIELRGLGWSPQQIASRQVRLAQSEFEMPAGGQSLPRVLFDVSDLISYFQRARTPTGIQRVQICVISELLRQPDPKVPVGVICFADSRDFWLRIPEHLFLELSTLAPRDGNIEDPIWRDALAELGDLLDYGPHFEFAGGETLINLGTSWWLQNYFLQIRMIKARYGVRYVPFVHDLIPIITPEHCVLELTQDFISWLIGVFFHADGFLTNSQATASDLNKVSGLLGHSILPAVVIPLDGRFDYSEGAIDPDDESQGQIEWPQGPFVLFVSTIESRKNHLLAFDLWLELIRRRGERLTPTLVCVGNEGWMVEAAMARLASSELLQRKVKLMRRLPDVALARLYRECLFTIYPSSYEGWGLPVTEALCFGKVVVTTSVSSLPEAGGRFAEYFDPRSTHDMRIKIERLIDDPMYRRSREREISAAFTPRSWTEIAEQIVRGALCRTEDEPAPTARFKTKHGWVFPVPAQRDRYYSLGRNRETSVWPGIIGGEIYRMGSGWSAPEDWGTWIKGERARLAFTLPPDDSRHLLYLGLVAPPSLGVRYRVQLLSNEAAGCIGVLEAGETRWVSLAVSANLVPAGFVHLAIANECDRRSVPVLNGEEPRVHGVGVKGFYLCSESDVASRLRFVEALQMNRLDDLMGRPEETLVFDRAVWPQC